ncbi:hypothetical protein ASPWEDRAFT_22264 [Aspergillus wentii DTO 134E9]|uniref:SigF-like NTF2-like domain-containing protein n=1 Tax=Aspergillus wentii DTO 134E9 TaxID=1073089 RepID=A0A1L9RYR2_ASPWE|nr:uncharacterized protein ASPWEDRAFT_22264 [Aspergillus wentii DTO 134E9]KAI9932488.1 hypothetical protein MW887_008729 [Aspergillus wentii]OJJ40055.1 hypothetical protein ASPWEDRAFT_22264 [Aspergillus wentii DTO 134E9]
MDDPVLEVPTVISLLTQSPPSLQQKTIEKFFTPSASFAHPFCRVWSFRGSRWALIKIYQWYKIMSPRIELQVHSVAYDEKNLKLYVNLSQIFSIWVVPFHVAPVNLTTVLTLTTDPGNDDKHLTNGEQKLYYISHQEDLYQTSEFIKFLLPHVGHLFVLIFHVFATFFCILGVAALWPLMWLEEKRYVPGQLLKGGNIASNMAKKIPEIKDA